MADPADARAAYKEALARAEAAALAGETPQTLTTSAAVETPAVPEETVAAETTAGDQTPPPAPAAPADTASEEQVAAPVVSDEAARIAELERQLAEREARIAEQQSMIGRQSTEVGELRQTVEQIQQRMQAPPPPVVAITQELIDNDPAQATVIAFQQQNEQALNLAFEAWKLEDPVTAAQWYADRRVEAMEAQMNARLEAVRGELAQASAPVQEAVEREQAQAAWREAFSLVDQQIPGFSQSGDAVRLLEEVAPQFPAIAQSIAAGDSRAKAEGLTLLYSFDRSRSQDPAAVAAAAAEEARAAAEAAAAARAEAAVVSQETAGQGGSAPELTPEQAEAARMAERYRQRSQPFGGTWSGR